MPGSDVANAHMRPLTASGSIPGYGSAWREDVAILATLPHTGLRVSELHALRVDSLELSMRKGLLQV
jgi:site-specific recombinase XerC